MGLFDTLKGVIGEAEAAGVPQMLEAALAKTSMGNLQGVLNQLQASGLGAQVQSWLGSGANLPITADELRAALGNEQVQQLARHFGVDPDAVLKLLENQLPAVVDAASPNGSVAAAS
jgi:uncharacterized protein YidB (DUF937 family)